jgi:fatty-acid desaturase
MNVFSYIHAISSQIERPRAQVRALFRQMSKAARKRLTLIGMPRLSVIPILQVVTTLVAIWAAIWGEFDWKWWVLAGFIFFLINCVGHEVTFHRLLSHRSFQLARPLEHIFSTFGAMGGTGSSLGWVVMHHEHHAHTDRRKDPHSPHVTGWRLLFSQYTLDTNDVRRKRLLRDRYHLISHRFYYFILSGWGAFLFIIGFEWFLFVFVIPMALHINILNLTNIVGHSIGYRNFKTNDRSVNNPIMAILNWGVGWHNNHHNNPSKWNFRVRWWEFDPSALVILAVRKRPA